MSEEKKKFRNPKWVDGEYFGFDVRRVARRLPLITMMQRKLGDLICWATNEYGGQTGVVTHHLVIEALNDLDWYSKKLREAVTQDCEAIPPDDPDDVKGKVHRAALRLPLIKKLRGVVSEYCEATPSFLKPDPEKTESEEKDGHSNHIKNGVTITVLPGGRLRLSGEWDNDDMRFWSFRGGWSCLEYERVIADLIGVGNSYTFYPDLSDRLGVPDEPDPTVIENKKPEGESSDD